MASAIFTQGLEKDRAPSELHGLPEVVFCSLNILPFICVYRCLSVVDLVACDLQLHLPWCHLSCFGRLRPQGKAVAAVMSNVTIFVRFKPPVVASLSTTLLLASPAYHG
jgi:hypothetical protein